MPDKSFDRIVKDKFEHFNTEPKPTLWENISKQLDEKRAKKRIPYFWLSAACVLILASFAFWFNSNSVPNSDLNADSQLVQAPENPITIISETEPKVLNIAVAKAKQSRPATKTKSSPSSLQTAAIVSRPDLKSENLQTQVLQEEKLVVESESLSAATETPLVVAAETEIEEAAKPAKRRVRSLSDLVNFVVAKVDRREDKLIETSDQDAVLEISALNLGLLKFKKSTPTNK